VQKAKKDDSVGVRSGGGAPAAARAQRLEEARVRSRDTALAAESATAEFKRQAALLPTLQPRSITEADLKPGDVLLVYGSSPFISAEITRFESAQLGGESPYSHAEIYLGTSNGTGMVAEMLRRGFWVSTLLASTRDDYIVDVYRWENIDDATRRQLADKATHPYGAMVQSGAPLPYAAEQIAALVAVTLAAKLKPVPIVGDAAWQTAIVAVNYADSHSGGRRKMICSEMVAWVYHDLGLEIKVKHWNVLADNNLVPTEDRRKDYTTPNMLARSGNLHMIGRLRGP
jgi:hypothetical protein